MRRVNVGFSGGVTSAWTRGRTIVGGELQYVSPSQIVSADHESFGGCLRRWWYRRVEGRPEPENAAAAVGTAGHAEIEEYLLTGKMVLGAHALNAKRYLPAPSPDLALEIPIDDGTLTLAGLPVVGFIDWLNTSGTVALDDGPRVQEGIEVVDWKFTGRRDFPSATEVGTALPMAIYGEWAARRTGAALVRLSHVYISTRQRNVSKRSILRNRSELGAGLERAERVVRRLQQAARCSTAAEVDANTDACTAYGGCPHRAYCQAGEQRTLADLLGATAAANLTKERNPMSLLNIPALAALKNSDPAVASEKAKLIAEEQAAKVDPAVKAAVEAIVASGYGQPTLTGAAAVAWAAARGLDFQGHGLTGHGMLAQATFSDPADLIKAADELRGLPAPTAATAAPQAAGLLPPDAPASDPFKAAAALETPAEPTPSATTGQAAQPDTVPAPAAPAEDSGELKLSKKARAQFEAMQARVAELERQNALMIEQQAEMMLARAQQGATAAAPAGIQVFVDCTWPAGATDLSTWVHEQARLLAKQYGAADVRCAPDGTPLAFGKWRGALSAVYREAALGDGDYYLDARGSDLAEVAAEALRSRGRVTRGIR